MNFGQKFQKLLKRCKFIAIKFICICSVIVNIFAVFIVYSYSKNKVRNKAAIVCY